MYFDPADNLFGQPWWAWLAVFLVWMAVLWAFYGPPDCLTRQGWARERRIRALKRQERASGGSPGSSASGRPHRRGGTPPRPGGRSPR